MISFRISIFALARDMFYRYTLQAHGGGNSGRGSAKDSMTELAESSQEKSAPRVNRDHDYGDTERRVCQSERASEAAQLNSTLGRRMRS